MLVSKVNYSSSVNRPKVNFGASESQFATFSLKDPKCWEECVQENRRDLGGLEFAARWANMMEEEMSKGAKLRDVVSSTGLKAAYEGMSGHVGECATTILIRAWKYGNVLKKLREMRFTP